MTSIRLATDQDRNAIRAVYLSAFADEERQLVSALAVDLLGETTDPETICLVAEADGAVIGHVAFSPVTIHGDETCRGYILAPLGVRPEYQGQGVGSALIKDGMSRLSGGGFDIVFVYGDPAYYGRHGFCAATAEGYSPPYPLEYPFGWQATRLRESASRDVKFRLSCVASLNKPELW